MANSAKHHRRSIRLPEYNYTACGYYFVTICTHNRRCLFGRVVNGEVILNELGKIIKTEWLRTAEIRPNINLDAYVIMPNHLHGIIIILESDGVGMLCRSTLFGRGTLQRAPTTNGTNRDQIWQTTIQFDSNHCTVI